MRDRLAMALFAVVLLASASVRAEAPALLPLQGYLTRDDGVPVDGKTQVRFRIYTTAEPSGRGDEIVHEELQELDVSQGHFAAYLGEQVPLGDLAVFRDHEALFVGLLVEDDQDEMRPLMRLGTAPYAAFARYCADAATFAGRPYESYLSTREQKIVNFASPSTESWRWRTVESISASPPGEKGYFDVSFDGYLTCPSGTCHVEITVDETQGDARDIQVSGARVGASVRLTEPTSGTGNRNFFLRVHHAGGQIVKGTFVAIWHPTK